LDRIYRINQNRILKIPWQAVVPRLRGEGCCSFCRNTSVARRNLFPQGRTTDCTDITDRAGEVISDLQRQSSLYEPICENLWNRWRF